MDSEIEVIANPILIDILIGNILSNAIRHSEIAGIVSVKHLIKTHYCQLWKGRAQ